MKTPSTPFPTTGYYGPDYFCDREEETRSVLTNIRGGVSTVIVARRRMGKTALLLHVLNKKPSGFRSIYLDILSTENRNDFLNELATSLVRDTLENRGFGKKLWDFVRSLRPVLKFDELTGAPQVSFQPGIENVEEKIEAILLFLEKQERKIIIAIDEFQQILKYPEQNTDAVLRTFIQRMKNLIFIFSGSHQNLMTELFTLPARPFYNSTAFMKLNPIEGSKYSTFIMDKFKNGEITISEEVIQQVLKWTDLHTYYVQLLCNRLFLSGAKEITGEVWKEEASKLLVEQEPIFFNYRGMLTAPQWNLLKSIGRENEVFEVTSSDFISRHDLGAPATVLRSLNALIRMELIHSDYSSSGRKFYKINDLLFRRWAETMEI